MEYVFINSKYLTYNFAESLNLAINSFRWEMLKAAIHIRYSSL